MLRAEDYCGASVKIYLVRHSTPEEGSPDDDEEADAGRELTDEGRKIVESLAEWMRDKGEFPTVIYTSPTQRTRETAEILQKELGVPVLRDDVSIGPHSSIRGRIKALADDDSITRPMIVSHHESISHGLRALGAQPDETYHLPLAEGELRILKVKRKGPKILEHRRVMPSKLGNVDHY